MSVPSEALPRGWEEKENLNFYSTVFEDPNKAGASFFPLWLRPVEGNPGSYMSFARLWPMKR